MSLNMDTDDPASYFELTPEQYNEAWEALSASWPNVQLMVPDPNDYSLEEAIEENELWASRSSG